jgi:hypothetical protein
MRIAIAVALLVPSIAAADHKVIEMPPDPVGVADDKPKVIETPSDAVRVATVDEALAADVSEPAPPPPVVKAKWIEPYGAIAGGMRMESIHQPEDQQRGTQNPTVAVSRLGLRGGVGEHITFASEFEAALGGPLGYGASVWEGQAALAVRDQYVRYARGGFNVAAGRVADPASYDFVSHHIGDLLYTDLYTRDSLLYSGADRGNGIFASYQLGEHVTTGLAFHSTNPTGITGTLIIGGKLQPFDRPFFLASAAVGNNQNNLPDQNLHIYFGSPSVRVQYKHFEAQTEAQIYTLDTQQSIMDDQTIRGYNLRLGARAWVDAGAGKLSAFANVSRNRNEILDPVDSKYRLPDLFRSYTFSTGLDWDIQKRNGLGFQYAVADTREPDMHVRLHYLNLATTYWIEDSLAVSVRGSIYAQQISGEMMTTGSRSLFVTARFVLE